jgi:predicted dienelactone hydrolase
VEIAKRGRAGLQICSTVFVAMGRMQARALGQPDLPIVAVPHPFGGRSRDEVRAIAQQCAGDIAAVMMPESAQ